MQASIPFSLFSRVAFPSALVFAIALTGCAASNYNNSDGVKYYGQAQYEKALNSFQAARYAAPEEPDSYYNTAATYDKLGTISRQTGQESLAIQQFTTAEEGYKLALAKDPDFAEAYRGLASMWCQLGHPDQAFELLRNWSLGHPASIDAKIELARLYHEYGRVGDASALLQSALAVDPKNARALRAAGFMCEQSGRVDIALENYRLSLESDAKQQDLSDRVALLKTRETTPSAAPYQAQPSYPNQQVASGPAAVPYTPR